MIKNFFKLLLVSITFHSCVDAGNTDVFLNGDESQLPDELKGLKIYRVQDIRGGSVKVAVMPDGRINSTTEQRGKITRTVITLDGQTKNIVGDILMDNDSLILIKKTK